LAIRQPSLVSIIQSDYAAFMAVLVPGIVVSISLAVAFLINLPDNTTGAAGVYYPPGLMLSGAAAAALAGAAVLVWRVWTIRGVFSRGVEGSGVLTKVALAKDRGQVSFQYEHAGQTYECGCSVHRSRRTRQLKKGALVGVVVDASDPRRAVLTELYS
jgi:hypothetical protein